MFKSSISLLTDVFMGCKIWIMALNIECCWIFVICANSDKRCIYRVTLQEAIFADDDVCEIIVINTQCTAIFERVMVVLEWGVCPNIRIDWSRLSSQSRYRALDLWLAAGLHILLSKPVDNNIRSSFPWIVFWCSYPHMVGWCRSRKSSFFNVSLLGRLWFSKIKKLIGWSHERFTKY